MTAYPIASSFITKQMTVDQSRSFKRIAEFWKESVERDVPTATLKGGTRGGLPNNADRGGQFEIRNYLGKSYKNPSLLQRRRRVVAISDNR
jgi:hypothetical protein